MKRFKVKSKKLKVKSLIPFAFFLLTFSLINGQEQREYLYGTEFAPKLTDTLSTIGGNDTLSISREILYKGPKVGFISIYGKIRVLRGSDTTITMYYQELGSVFDPEPIWSKYDSLSTIFDGDTTFFVSVATPETFRESDGIRYKFVMPSGGSRAIEIMAVTKIR